MKVEINGTTHTLPDVATVADAARAIQAKSPFAVAVNLQFVPASRHATTALQPSDRVEIIRPVTGG